MDKSTIMIIAVEKINDFATSVQDVLIKHGCIIKTRLGLHEATDALCSSRGLIILQLCTKEHEIKKLETELLQIQSVKVKILTI